MQRMLVVVSVLALAGCGSPKLGVSHDGRAVLRDAYDGHLDRHWSCASLKAAYRRLPQDGPTYSAIPLLIGNAAGQACDEALAAVHVGDLAKKVVAALGAPEQTGRWWLYRWPAGRNTGDGARILIVAGRVTRIQVSLHG